MMNVREVDDLNIGIVADPSNYAAEQFLEKQLSLSTNTDPRFSHCQVIPDALNQNISSRILTDEISEKFNKGYHVVVAIVGVPDTSGYKTDIHGLLNAWEKSSEKPALLLVSNQPALTTELVESWSGWKHLPDELKSAIKVNDEYLVTSGHKALDELDERLRTSQALHALLAEAKDDKLHPLVTRPAFTQSSHVSMPYIIKG